MASPTISPSKFPMASPKLFPSIVPQNNDDHSSGFTNLDIANIAISAFVFSVFIGFTIYFIIFKEEPKSSTKEDDIDHNSK